MEIISDKELATFFSEYPLYSKIKFLKNYPISASMQLPENLTSRVAFKFFCPRESDVHTFKLEKAQGNNAIFIFALDALHVFTNSSKKVDWSCHVVGVCQSCNYEVDILVNLFSEEDVDATKNIWPELYLKKIGQFPPFERMPEAGVYSYLTAEDKENYKKALANLAVSYGIGAYAYFRRIIENEIKRIVEDISKLEFEGVDKVREAWKEYEKNHQMNPLIENIYQYLPKSLKEVTGDNPLKLLHQQLSQGIHELPEDECLKKAKQIDVLLRYVIKKVNSERYELKELRDAMTGLRTQ